MEAFRIVCPSCHGKLVIRHDWLLGKSIHCPRCKAVVVVPSVAGESPSKSGVSKPSMPTSYDSTAITRVDDGRLAQEIAQEFTSAADGLSGMDDQAFASALEAFRTENAGSPTRTDMADEPSLLDSSDFVASASPSSENSRPPMGLDWDSPAIQLRRQILMIVMAGVAGLLLAGGGLLIFFSMRTPAEVADANPPSDLSKAADAEAGVLNPAPEVAPPIANDSIAAQADSADSTKIGMDAPPELPTTDPNISLGPETVVSNDAVVPTVAPSTNDSNLTSIDPANPSSNPAAPSDATTPPATQDTSTDIPEAMRRFSGLFDPSSVLSLPDAMTTSQPTEVQRENIEVESLYHPPSIPLLPWDEIRETKLPGLKIVNEPCSRSMILLGQLAAIGIGWDSATMRLVDKPIDDIVTLDLQDKTLEQAIQQIASAVGATYAINDELPQVLVAGAEISKGLPTTWSLSDLSEDPKQLEAWRLLIARFFPVQAAKWRWNEKELEWDSSATPEDKAIVAGFFDQVRRAVGAPPQSKLPLTLTDPIIGVREIDAKLGQRGQRVLIESMSLSQVFDNAARDVGIELLYDWPSLFSHGFAHSVSGLRLVRGRTLFEIIEPTLDRFALVAVADGPSRIVLTTLPKQRRMWRTVIVPVTDEASVEKTMESFRLLSPADSDGRSMLDAEMLPEVSQSKERWAIVRICVPNTKQLRNPKIRKAFGMNN